MTLQAPFPEGVDPGAGAVADWVEFTALASRAAFKIGDLKSALSVENIDKADLLEQQVWDELKSRSDLHGANWPLSLNGSRLTKRRPAPVSLDLYRFLCCLGMGLLEPEDRQLFELIVADLMPVISSNTSLHVGHPASAGMDSSFRERVKEYCTRSGMLKEEVMDPPLPSDMDLGIDAVTWMPFSDARSGYLHFLAQCATGANWRDKTSDIVIPTWFRHLHWGVQPVRIFAVPFVIVTTNEKWLRICDEAGLVLDRPRLVELSTRRPAVTALAPILRRRVATLAA